MNTPRRSLWLFACLGLAPFLHGFGCQDPDEPPPDCDERIGGEATGRWNISAEGQRKNCKDPYLNGKMKLDVQAFGVEGTPVPTSHNDSGDAEHEADAFVERIKRAQYVLEADGTPSKVKFSGQVNTCEIAFTLSERLPDGRFHSYEFNGFVESRYRLYGRFSGEGPGSCEVSGEFEVDID